MGLTFPGWKSYNERRNWGKHDRKNDFPTSQSLPVQYYEYHWPGAENEILHWRCSVSLPMEINEEQCWHGIISSLLCTADELLSLKPRCLFQFYEEVTRKLLVTLLNVQDQRAELIDIIKRKDAEIAQYKIEGASLARSKFWVSEHATRNSNPTELKFQSKLQHNRFLNRNSMVNLNWCLIQVCSPVRITPVLSKKCAITVTWSKRTLHQPRYTYPKSRVRQKCSIVRRREKRMPWGSFVQTLLRLENQWISLVQPFLHIHRKFQSKKECKIQYESSFELLISDGEMEQDGNAESDVRKDDAIGDSMQRKEAPKRKLRSKLNL